MSTDVTYCPAPGCGRRVHGYLFTVAWLAVGMWSSVDAYVVASRR